MAFLKPKPYSQNNSPSTTSLLTPQSRSPAPQSVQAAFAQSQRSASASDTSLVSAYHVIGRARSDRPALGRLPVLWQVCADTAVHLRQGIARPSIRSVDPD